METIFLTLFIILTILSVANFLILVYLAGFLVRLRGFVSDIVDLFMDNTLTETPPVEDQNMDVKPKTWDQKYEEELEFIQRQIQKEKGEPGLVEP